MERELLGKGGDKGFAEIVDPRSHLMQIVLVVAAIIAIYAVE